MSRKPGVRLAPVLNKNITEETISHALYTCFQLHLPSYNSLYVLNLLFANGSYDFKVSFDDTSKLHTAALYINNTIHVGTDPGKQNSKVKAANSALHTLFPVFSLINNSKKAKESAKLVETKLGKRKGVEDLSHLTVKQLIISNGDVPLRKDVVPSPLEPKPKNYLSDHNSLRVGARVSELIGNAYKAAVSSYGIELQRFAVLSGVVLVRDGDWKNAQVICITTGNKCVHGDVPLKNGDVVFDSHAEILARRGIIHYFYDQLERAYRGDDSIMDTTTEKARVKSGVQLFLYVSSSPCGDGRVFSRTTSQKLDRPKAALKRGLLRVKLETGMGGIPVTNFSDPILTCEQYARGKQVVIMCCSEKLYRANILGVQGALLTHLLQPVYLAGIIIDETFVDGTYNISRSVLNRIPEKNLDMLPEPYHLNTGLMVESNRNKVPSKYLTAKAQQFSMNWMITDPQVEFIKPKTGKTVTNVESRLSKKSFLKRFMDIAQSRKSAPGVDYTSKTYLELKNEAFEYQQAKYLLFEMLEANGRGHWLIKPDDRHMFSITTKENLGTTK